MTQTTKPNCCAGQCNYGPGCTKEIEALYQLANPHTESRSPMTSTTQKPHIFDPVSGEWFRIVDFRMVLRGETYMTNDGYVTPATIGISQARNILEHCDPPPPSKEWEALRVAAEKMVSAQGAADPISCPNSGNENSALRGLTNALVALPTPEPQERQSSEGQIERRGDWSLEGSPDYFTSKSDANPLIDAACAVVNDPGEFTIGGTIQELATALDPFTQAVNQERFTVTPMRSPLPTWLVFRDESVIAKFDYEQDAKDFAAYKNEQEGEK